MVKSKINKLKEKLFQPVSIYSLVFMRLAFGAIMFFECWRYLFSDRIFNYYIEPKFFFKYYGFSWITPLPENLMYWLFCLLAFLSILVMIGAFYRVAIILFTIGFSYIFLLDQANYLNHFYMVILFSTLLCFMPAHHYFSVDSRLQPKIKSDKIPFWSVFMLRLQMEIILIFAGLVKINPDWIYHLQPLKMWLEDASENPFLNYLFTQNWSLTISAYGIIVLHLIGAPLLLFRKTRIYIFTIYCCFHILNSHIFNIGIFPWFTIMTTLIFFDPDWPKKFFKSATKEQNKNFKKPSNQKQNLITALILIWTIAQILIPLRNLLYPSNVAWSQEGHRFSWRMKLRNTEGYAIFYITDIESGQRWKINNEQYLTKKQLDDMQCRPDMILQFAHYLQKIWYKKGFVDVAITIENKCSLNGRAKALLIDPNVDLTQIKRNLKHSDWILPLNEEIPK